VIKIKDFIKKEDFIQAQIDSYNWLIYYGLQEVIEEQRDFTIDVEDYNSSLGKVKIGKPVVVEAGQAPTPHYPFECRLRNLTYSAPIELEFIENGKSVPVEIGYIPVMVLSDLCLLKNKHSQLLSGDQLKKNMIKNHEDSEDMGGYFIINGTERVLIVVEDLAPNRIVTTFEGDASKPVPVAKVFSVRQGFRSRVIVEKRESQSGETLFASFPGISSRIPLTLLMRACGFNDAEIMDLFDDPLTRAEVSLNLDLNQITPQEAFKQLGKRAGVGHAKMYQSIRANQVLNNFLLPHLGNDDEYRVLKAEYLAIMAKKVIELAFGMREADDKDHYSNKRLRLAGDLLQELFRVSFNTLVKDIKYQIEKQNSRRREINIKTAVRSGALSERIEYAMATGNWTGGRAGVSQVLDRTNYLSSISHMRRVSSLLSRSHPHFEARDLHSTQWGRICPNETPEGQNCGLVKNLAVGTRVSQDRDDSVVEEYLKEFGMESFISIRDRDQTLDESGSLDAFSEDSDEKLVLGEQDFEVVYEAIKNKEI